MPKNFQAKLRVGDCNVTCLAARARETAEKFTQRVEAQLESVHVNDCTLADADCLTALSRNATAAAEKAIEDMEVRVQTLRVNDCNLTDAECLTKQSRVAAMQTGQRIQAQLGTVKVNGCSLTDDACLRAQLLSVRDELSTVRVLECNLTDTDCLRRRGQEVGASLQLVMNSAVKSFEQAVGCSIDDVSCLQARAATLAHDATQEASSAVITTVGCGGARDVEGCLLRRAQELSTALAVVVSATTLTSMAGR